MFGFFRRRRRPALRATPPSPEWRAIVERRVPYVARLSAADQDELFGHMQVFLAEKSFEGQNGLAITDEVRVTIAAQACVLLLHRATDYYPTVRTILVYPTSYVVPPSPIVRAGLVAPVPEVRLGESWSRDLVVLAWDGVLTGAANTQDGENLVFHEFAHALDHEDGAGDGAPVLGSRARYAPWAKTLSREYDTLVAAVDAGTPTLIDGYGARNSAEFFAVLTEMFFERPTALRRRHPALYEQMRTFYAQDPMPENAAPVRPTDESG